MQIGGEKSYKNRRIVGHFCDHATMRPCDVFNPCGSVAIIAETLYPYECISVCGCGIPKLIIMYTCKFPVCVA